MKTLTKVFLLAAFLVLGMIGYAPGAASDSHTVTVTVSAINELLIIGGNVTLTINTATAGSEPDDAVDSTTADVVWTTNAENKKITIESNLAAPNFTLKAVAQGVSGGTAAPEVTVTDTAADFVTGIAKTIGVCDIQYTAQATAAQGTGSDVHTITFTLTGA